MERGSKYKAQPLRSTLTPETEKRLLGNLKPPKNKFVQSNKPTRIEHIDPSQITAPKASEDMSKLASFQEFSKAFVSLENEIKTLRQFSCPPNAEKMFDSVAEIKGSIPVFETHCKTIAKQKKLQTEVSKKSFDYYKDFVQQFQLFSDKMHIFYSQIHQLYKYGITQAFHSIEDAIEIFFDISNKDPQSRSICLQYKKYCDKSLNYLGETLAYFIESNTFDGFTDEELAKFAEKAKTFGRFFEKELYPVVLHSLPPNLSFGNCISLFHDNYTKIVPLIVSAPRFLENFSEVLSKLDIANNCIQQVKKEIGDENDIDLIEFTICIYYFLRAADSQEELINAFKIFDKDQTGKLPVNQVKEILASLKHPVSTSLVNEVLKQVPADRNNMVNYADMIRLMRPN